MSKLKDFVVTTARPLPVILLADVSGSMATNGKIDALNDAIQSMIESFATEDHSRAEIHVSVIAFGKGGARLHQPLLPAAQIKWNGSPQRAIRQWCCVRPGREDGRGPRPDSEPSYRDRRTRIRCQPTDEWREPCSACSHRTVRQGSRFVLESEMTPTQQCWLSSWRTHRRVYSRMSRQIKNFFRWVTMSVTQRTRSVNQTAWCGRSMALDEYDF